MKQAKNSKTVILAAGGTGGHIFPAEALAEVLRARGFDPQLVTDHRFHHYNKNSNDGVLGQIPIHTIRASGISGGVVKRIASALGIVVGVVQAMRVIKRTQPIAVVGFGGYPSFPTMLGAVALGRRTLIHEQNSVLGRVNRLLANQVSAIATTYAATQKMPTDAAKKVTLTGNPVRASLAALAQIDYPELANDGLLRVLVLGGSQGASVFSDVVPAAMKLLPENLRGRIRLDQQCRAGEIEKARAAYQALGMQVDLAPFFTDVAARLAAAHVVIARAGASTVAELMVAGRPALLVPLPIATDNHQYFNAQAVEDTGAGWVVTQDAFTPESLAVRLETWLGVPQRLSESAAAMRLLGTTDAAEKLADVVLQQTHKNNHTEGQELAA